MKRRNRIRKCVFIILGFLLILFISCKKDNPINYAIGQPYQGGIIAYILLPGDPGYDKNVPHGLIAALADYGTKAEWGCLFTSISGADGTAIGTGNQNTIEISNGCSEVGIAAKICYDLIEDGYSDWYLPSKDELNKLYLNRNTIGGLDNGFYWSSSEVSSDNAWFQMFEDGLQYNNGTKFSTLAIRAVRSF